MKIVFALVLLIGALAAIGPIEAADEDSDIYRAIGFVSNLMFGNLDCNFLTSHKVFSVWFNVTSAVLPQGRQTRSDFMPILFEHFDPRQRTAVLVHGYMVDGKMPSFLELQKQLLKWDPKMNVILVDWIGGSKIFMYEQAARNTIHVAKEIRKFFNRMFVHWESKGVKRSEWGPVHFLGHSLGAHASGQAAHYLKQQDGFRVNRITGLDPAEPCFEEPRETEPKRLSRDDADFVDIVHTDGAVTRNAALGLMDPIGDLDFYIDGGSLQPDCMGAVNEAKKRTELYKYFLGYVKIARHIVFDNAFCNHLRAVDVFVESVRYSHEQKDCPFWSIPWNLNAAFSEVMKTGQHIWKCQSNTCAEMGIEAERHPEHLRSSRTANTFYVPTVDRPKECVKYFSDHHRGMYVDTYPKRSYLEKMAMYLDDAFELVKNQISIPIPGFLENIRQKIRNVLSRVLG